MYNPTPSINIGNPYTSQLGDSSAEAYSKYNQHSHPISYPASYLTTGIKPGYSVSGFNSIGIPCFNSNTKVESISNNIITFDSLPIISGLCNITFVFGNFVYQLEAELNNTTNYIELTENQGGFINSKYITYVANEYITNNIVLTNPLSLSIFNLILKSPFNCYLTKSLFQLNTGNLSSSAGITLTVNNRTLLSGSIFNSITTFETELNTNNYSSLINVDDTITLSIGSLTTIATDILLTYSLNLVKI